MVTVDRRRANFHQRALRNLLRGHALIRATARCYIQPRMGTLRSLNRRKTLHHRAKHENFPILECQRSRWY